MKRFFVLFDISLFIFSNLDLFVTHFASNQLYRCVQEERMLNLKYI